MTTVIRVTGCTGAKWWSALGLVHGGQLWHAAGDDESAVLVRGLLDADGNASGFVNVATFANQCEAKRFCDIALGGVHYSAQAEDEAVKALRKMDEIIARTGSDREADCREASDLLCGFLHAIGQNEIANRWNVIGCLS